MSETKQTNNNKKKIAIVVAAIIALLGIIFGVLALCGVFDKKEPEDNTVKITITIEVNGGAGTYDNITVELDENKTYTFTNEEKTAITDALNREGYDLKGLSTTPDGEGSWTITIDEDTPSPLKIYAIWEKKEPLPPVEKYTITFDMHGHGTAPEDITDATALPAELPTVEDDGDWIFAGWYLDEEYETAATAGATITTNTTLHAKWETIFTHYGNAVTGLTAYGMTLNLTEITIPTTLDGDEITSIGANAFINCTNLTSVTIPEGITSIGQYAFSGCTGLESITIPQNLTSIGQRAFHNCTGLESVTMLEGVTSIDYYAFRGCTSLTSIEIPVSLTSISYYVFDDCTSLETVYYKGASSSYWDSINIDHHNTELTDATIYYYSEAPEVNADGTDLKDNYWHYVGGVPTIWTYAERVFTYNGNTVTGLTDYGKTLSTIIIPSVIAGDEITKIGYAAFNFCDNLANVVIPNSVTSIGEAAFSYCTSLTSIEIPSSVTSIGAQAFNYCGNLTSIEIPSSVTSIGYNAFANCTGLTSVTIPNSVTSLQGSTFRDCTSLESITIPSSVASLGNYTFMDCTGLISVIIPNGLTSIGYGTFDGCTGLTTVYYGGADSAAWSAIEIDGFNVPLTTATRYYYSEEPEVNADGTDLKDNYWHYVGGVPTIWTYAERVFTYNGNTVTGLTAYAKTLNLTKITIPSTINGEQITSIGYGAFTFCDNLTNIEIPNGITSIDSSAFTFCHGLTSVTIPNSVTSIGSGAFAYCENLTTVTLPDGITSLPYMSFAYCTSLESVIIPDSVTSIESSAFGMIDSLITVYYKGTSAEWGGIEIDAGNTAITNGTRYYYSVNPPETEGNYWHDVDGEPVIW